MQVIQWAPAEFVLVNGVRGISCCARVLFVQSCSSWPVLHLCYIAHVVGIRLAWLSGGQESGHTKEYLIE